MFILSSPDDVSILHLFKNTSINIQFCIRLDAHFLPMVPQHRLREINKSFFSLVRKYHVQICPLFSLHR